MKKVLSILLAVAMIACLVPTAFATRKCDCGYTPLIIVPGIMQSQTYLVSTPEEYKGNGHIYVPTDPADPAYIDGKKGYIMTNEKTVANNNNGFPVVEGMDMGFMFDTNAILENVKERLPELLLKMTLADNEGIFKIVSEVLDEALQDHYFNTDGTPVYERSVDKYPYSYKVAKNIKDRAQGFAKGYRKDDAGNVKPTANYEFQSNFIDRQVDMSKYMTEYGGEDHIYYYSYPSFGNTFESAAGLKDYIELVKEQTGHDKVTICFISLGGTLANVFLSEYYDECKDSIDRIVLAACAIDGSYLLGDLMDANTTLADTSVIYNDLIPNLVSLADEAYMPLAYMGNTIARIIPEELFNSFLERAFTKAVNEALGKMIRNCPSMWSLVPSDQYESLAAKYISDADHAELKKITDKYYNIQKNAKATIQKRDAEGADIFVICGYNLELPALVKHFRESSDNIIQSSSTSVGGTFAYAGQKLDTSKIKDFDAKYLSPDGNAYLGTCALPDKTFAVYGQSHLKLQSSVRDVIELCIQIAVDPDLKNATTDNKGYAQFNQYRDLSEIEHLVSAYLKADESKRAGATQYYDEAVEMLNSRVWNNQETKELEAKFATAMDKAKITKEQSFLNYKVAPFFEKFFKVLSDIFEKIFNNRDFYPVPWFLLSK